MNLFENILKNVAPATSSTNQFLSGFQKPQEKPLVAQVQEGVKPFTYTQPTQAPQPVAPQTPKPKMTLFKDEYTMLGKMKADGLDDNEAMNLLKQRRTDLLEGNTKLDPKEQTMLQKMVADNLSAKEATALIKQYRNDVSGKQKADFEKKYAEGNIAQKGAYNALMLGAGATEKVLQYGGNILDFATFGKLGFGEDVKKMQEVTQSPEFDSTAFKAGQVLPDVALGVAPIGGVAQAGKLSSMIAQGAKVGAGFGATTPILDKGSEATMGDIAQGGVVGGVLGGAIPGVLGGAFKGGQKVAKMITPQTAEEKILETVGGKTVKGIVQGKAVKIQQPKEGIITKLSTPFRTKDSKVLTGRALTPSYAGKTPKQMLKSVGNMTDNVKSFYDQVRTGKLKGNLNTLEDAANTVVSNLDEIGANIGNSVKGAKGRTAISMGTRSEMKRALANKIEKRAGAYSALQNFFKDTSKGLNLNDAFKAKRVYQTEIGKLIRSGDAGTDSYSALVKGVQELSDNIDNAVEKSIGTKQFIEWKKQYKLLKSIASDISKSAVVEGRRSPQTFVEQLGMLESMVEGVSNPLSTAKTVLAKEIGELNTRGGAWKELIKNYDKEAIQKAKKIIPKKVKVGQ